MSLITRKDIVSKLEELKQVILSGKLRDFEMFQGIHPLLFGQHLYQPLIYVNSELVDVKPVPLNEGEREFVLDLQDFCTTKRSFFKGRELYLLRNMTRGRGIGFFEAGNFYPDFILWLISDGKQHISFIDPKGLRNLKGEDDPKIAFSKNIKTIEDDLKAQDPAVTLDSFIIATTRLPEVSWWSGGMTKGKFEERHVLFPREDKATYIEKMLTKIRN